ncbi:MAG: DUF4835 family protein [Flavobacteriales bacterium]|jgi:hypothetical protein|nr:DUF4835 family protein [Flavobacteriales bacterium]NCF57567.1 DUF4835 family protein [Bacteroidota bacterium]MBT3572367.1 DUF4835 family protein [Flavobacteriales bacterium]MBT3739122.1 DUF4835 family protein [Flavobacteriales bacterium]MBT4103137.1 DUF4835 family protein [Flavobacteriales bacterium]
MIKAGFKYFFLTGLLLCVSPAVSAQEFFLDVRVQAPQVQSSDKAVFTTMQNALRDFVNGRSWTETRFEVAERIRGSLVFTIDEYQPSTGVMRGNLQVQFTRPVYMSDYQSPTMMFLDGSVDITYRENQSMEFNPGRFDDNLTSIIGFYCYLALGLDAASFSTESSYHLKQAQIIVANAQSANGSSGWSQSVNNRNRYWLIEELLSPANTDFLTSWYSYHRMGMDRMHSPVQQRAAKEAMSLALIGLHGIYERNPNSSLLRWYFDAKSQEIIQVFGDGPTMNQSDLIEALNQMDPSNRSSYLSMSQR